MHYKHGIVPLFCLIASVPALGAVSSSVPPASFLNYHAGSVRELSQEVTIDPIVRLRLARHFHLAEPAMTAYIRRNLALSHLKKAGRYQVACVRPDGTEYWVTSRLPAGTPVFASRATGQPILKLACGNPLVSALPYPARAADVFKASVPPQIADTPASAQTAPLATDETPALMADDNAIASALAPNDLLLDDTDLLPVIKAAGSFQTLGNIAGAARPFNFGPVLAGLAGSVALISLNGGSGHHSPDSPTSSVPVTPRAPVPEASTFLTVGAMLLLGTGAWLASRCKRDYRPTK